MVSLAGVRPYQTQEKTIPKHIAIGSRDEGVFDSVVGPNQRAGLSIGRSRVEIPVNFLLFRLHP